MGFTERVTRLSDYGTSRPAHAPVSQEFRSFQRHGLPITPGVEVERKINDRFAGKRTNFEAGHPRHVPETWPTLLSRDQLCAYIGVSADTLTRICPVRPLDLGASVVRWSRLQIDDWVPTLPPRLMVAHQPSGDTDHVEPANSLDEVAETRAEAALDRVRARAGGSKWHKTA